MKIKGGFRYIAKINLEEARIIQTALELLLDSYNYSNDEIDFDDYKEDINQNEVAKLHTIMVNK